ncbi:hypothetical protein GBA63_08785 [Rubrobacter tropicus]|uniref:Phasin domain-containing protein n=1 Tax=Rubrobacter tropicus TaxID=2653851 RepID=A0A6G8Q8D1_9ACTN|nr:hypothetical protein [Rubrobacter tropicus]QIN82730.1 hypothetical protein GBA63_08785 [Rubrobacter tropicus]
MNADKTRERREAVEKFDAAARQSYMAAVDRAFEVQKSGAKLSRTFFENWVQTLEEGVEINRRALEDLQNIAAEQREVFYNLSRESLGAYEGFVGSLDAYEARISENRETADKP